MKNIKIIEENFMGDNEVEISGTYFNKQYVFYKRYCKNYGDLCNITIGSYTYSIDTIGINVQEYSDFPESYKNILNIFGQFFDTCFFTEKQVNILKRQIIK